MICGRVGQSMLGRSRRLEQTHFSKFEEQERSIDFNRELGGERLFLVLVVMAGSGGKVPTRIYFTILAIVSPQFSPHKSGDSLQLGQGGLGADIIELVPRPWSLVRQDRNRQYLPPVLWWAWPRWVL